MFTNPMLTSIISEIIAGVSLILVAIINHRSSKADKRAKVREAELEKRAEQRAKESLLAMELMNANCQLTVGVAMAHKRGYPNGEIEKGLEMVEEAMNEYKKFHDKLAIEHLEK